MPRRLFPALMFLLLLTFCAPAKLTPPASPEAGAPLAESTLPPAAPTEPASAPAAARTATFASVENQVEARASKSDPFSPATPGQVLPVGGEVQTGEEGRARLDLLPEGTIVRLAPNSMFTLASLEGDESAPASKIQLSFGKIWILLNGGSLDVETPSGVASVRGSLLGVSFDPQTKSLTATCLEGHCALSDEDESIELTDGQAVDSFNGDIADEPRDMTEEETQEWQEEAPESEEFLDEAADAPTDIPTDAATEVPTEAPTDAPTEPPAPTDPPSAPPVDPPTEPPASPPPESGMLILE